MTIDFLSLVFIWLLPLTASSTVTSGQNDNLTTVMTGEVGNEFTHSQLTTQEASSLNQLSEVTTEKETTKPSTKPSLQTIQTNPSTFSPNIQTAAAPTNSISSQLVNNSSTVGTTDVQLKVTTLAAMVVTSQVSNPTKTTMAPRVLSSSTQGQDTGKTSTSQLTSDKITHSSTHPRRSTVLISNATTSTKTVESKSASTSPVRGGDATKSTGLYKTSMDMTKKPFTRITKSKKTQHPPEKNAKDKKGTNHSKVVAGVIGGSLVFMMVGFLVIYVKKRKLQRQQIMTSEWAGPSPFLDGGADNGQVTLRSSNRISLSSFLPQRLSKRLSLLPEADEELEDLTAGTTFGNKRQESTAGREVDGNDAQESNGAAVVVPEVKSTGDAPEPFFSGSPSQTMDPLSTNNNSEIVNPENPPTLSGTAENAEAQLNDGLGQP
ncbi:protein EVI2B [Morone saxatilis]|uniref:protein EVI2B n=1 Tax=Morone saxatilis TaxID=34816 RepID=UPI0015E1F359|nr:protein EVI2B [Morone saxatilis]